MDDPFLTLVVEALNLMHPRFAGAAGFSYHPDELGSPAAARRDREQPLVREFYHQFRRLWDKALPVRLGLGHVLTQADPELPADCRPDFLFWQLGENSEPDRRLGAVSLVLLANEFALLAELRALARCHKDHGYTRAVCVAVGPAAAASESIIPAAPGVAVVFFDTDRWSANDKPEA